MEKYLITGGHSLNGEVTISGAKNAAVAILPAALLCEDVCVIDNIPDISDVNVICKVLKLLGADIQFVTKNKLMIDCRHLRNTEIPDDLTRHMRASTYFLGALIGRFKEAKVSMPGGCNFGVRPIDQHIRGFEALGANVSLEGGIVTATADTLIGNQIFFDMVTVGATVNVMLAAVKAEGVTVIDNAAKEPHIVDLANFLNSMGADVRGAGTDTIKIHGVKHLYGTDYVIIPDQIEAGTFMVAAAATAGDVLIKNVIPKHLESISGKLVAMGVDVEEFDDSIRVSRVGGLSRTNIKTMPHPGFPTDMQPQIAVLATCADGTSTITEGVWDNRFRYVEELLRMGANIQVDGKLAVVEGNTQLKAAPVKTTDLRAGAALVIAALIAEGVTEIEDRHIARGYENLDEKLAGLGADIKRVIVPDEVIPAAL